MRKIVLLVAAFAGCTTEVVTFEGDIFEPVDTGWNEELQGVYDCSERGDTGYRNGNAYTITVVSVDGVPVERDTANAYIAMQSAAASQGVAIRIVSGFRTNAEQQYLYNCYRNCNCNNCNLAASPGYSNHQSGHALDLNTSASGVLNWLNNNGARFGFSRTVPSEPWHWEWWGNASDYSGPCGAPPPCPAKNLGDIVDGGVCTILRGPSAYWRSEGVGHGGGLNWTNAFVASGRSNWAEIRTPFAQPTEVRVEVYLHPAHAQFAQTRYKVKTASGERTIVVDQGALAASGAGFKTLGDFTLTNDSSVIIEDNYSVEPPADRKRIMVDAVRLSAVPAPPPPPPPAPEPEPVPEPVDDDEEEDVDVIDDEEDEDLLNGTADDEGRPLRQKTTTLYVDGGCAQSDGTPAVAGALLAIMLRRRQKNS